MRLIFFMDKYYTNIRIYNNTLKEEVSKLQLLQSMNLILNTPLFTISHHKTYLFLERKLSYEARKRSSEKRFDRHQSTH